MQTAKKRWTIRLAAGMAAAALAAGVMAHEPAGDEQPAECPPLPPLHGAGWLAAPGLPQAALRGIKLTEAQEDKLFELSQAQAPARRALAKQAARSHEDLRRAAETEPFDEARVRALAEVHAQAMARLFLMQAELDAKARALLTSEQRRQYAAARPAPCPPQAR